MEFVLGDLIWIFPHEVLSWCPGEIVKVEEDAYIAMSKDDSDDSLFRIEKQNAFPVHPSCLSKVPDLLSLGEFNEGALLHNIRMRYLENMIYTSVGIPILISINPYTRLPLYTSKISESYRNQSEKGTPNLVPHLFLMAEKAYAALREGNQSIIISGESGAGKTEAAKIILSYLAAGDTQNNLSKQVLDTNPILEAFGNAKTLRNDNSSRFGKFIEIHFDSVSLKLLSARILNYLLEKSRIVVQQSGERNYHFFYQLCAGASEAERERFHILPAEEFFYLNKSGCMEIEGVDDAQNYRETRECMQVLGFSEEEQEWVLRVVMGILHLGNVEFAGEETSRIVETGSMQVCCELLGVSVESLEKVLTTRVLIDPSNKEEIVMNQKPKQAYDTRDATAKAIYSKLFTWLVERINKTIYIQQKKPSKIIGLLDIYGFEVFDENSFEQFCINYANEKLQQHFNHHMFKLEQQEYSKEKIKWDHINYEDNQVCIDLIEKTPIGVISLLDEQCKLQKGSDKQFLSTVNSKLKENQKLCNPGPYASDFFGIGHYAGDVFYNVNGFLEKNKDTLNPQLIRAMEDSSLPLLRGIFASPGKAAKQDQAPGSLSAQTLATQFKQQLQQLIKALSGSTPSYIRCVKPNSEKSPKLFDSADVQRQLRCAGMLECIRIRKAGYSVRRSAKEFLDRYWIIAPESRNGSTGVVQKCKLLVAEMGRIGNLREIMDPEKKMIQVGISMVFMKDELRQALDIEYSKAAFKYAVVIQKHFRSFPARRKYKKVLECIRKIQKRIRIWLAMKRLQKKIRRIKSAVSYIVSKGSMYRKKAAVGKVKTFLRQASSKVYISYFKPIDIKIHRKKSENSSNEDGLVAEEPTNYTSISEELTPRHEAKKSNYLRELTTGSAPVIQTLQEEIKNLSYILTREKEKSKSLQEESLRYKDLYQNMLVQVQSMQSDSQMSLLTTDIAGAEKYKTEAQNLQRELKKKNNENEMLQMKIKSFNQTIEEIEESNKDLRIKESSWKKKLDLEMVKHTKEMEEAKKQLLQISSDKSKSDISAYEKEIRTLKLHVRSLENENSSLTNEVNGKTFKIENYEETEAFLKKQIKSLQEETRLLNDQYSKFDSQHTKNLVAKLSEQQSTIESLKQEIDDLQEKQEVFKNENNKLLYYQEESAKYIKQNNDKKATIKDLESQIEQLLNDKMELSRLKIEMQSLKPYQNQERDNEYIRNLKIQIDESNQEIEDLAKELETSKQVYGTLLTLLKIKNSELEAYKVNCPEPITIYKDEEDALLAQ